MTLWLCYGGGGDAGAAGLVLDVDASIVICHSEKESATGYSRFDPLT